MRNSSKIIIASVLMLAVFFPAVSPYAAASDGATTASEAASANDEATMKSFVLHAKQELLEAARGGAVSVLYREMRSEGEWRADSVYLIVLRRAGNIVNHGKYTKELYGDSLAKLPTVKELLDGLAGKDADADPLCTQYYHEGSKKWSCAVLSTPAIVGEENNVIIGGFDHELEDENIAPLQCPGFEPEVTADDVIASQYVSEERARETLKEFVKGAIERVKMIQAQGSQQGQGSLLQQAIRSVACFGKGHWNSGPIYLFVMTRSPLGPVVILNGNSPELTGSPFVGVLDEDGIDIGQEILKVAGQDGQGGFVEYKWDNPLIDEDKAEPDPKKSPGRSPKISYVEAVQFSPTSGTFIFGSGIYRTLEGGSESGGDDDSGCTIAGTDGSRSAGAAFNLFLILFSVCFVIWKGMQKKQRNFSGSI